MEENENKRIFVIKTEDDKNQDKPKMTWAGYVHQLNVYKFWILGFSLVATIAGYLGMQYIYNANKETLTTNITLGLALANDGTTYMDGSSFNYQNFVSTDTIAAVCNLEDEDGNKMFSLNVSDLIDDYAITITPQQVTVDGTTTDSKTNYVLTTSVKSFGNEATARTFIRCLINYQIDVANQAVSGYYLSSTLPSSEETFTSFTFEDMVNRLSAENKTIQEAYETLVETFGSTIAVDSSTRLSEVQSGYLNNSYTSIINSFSGSLSLNKYINITNSADSIEDAISYYENLAEYNKTQIRSLTTKIQSYVQIIENLSGSNSNSSTAVEAIQEIYSSLVSSRSEREDLITELETIGYATTKDDASGTVSFSRIDTNDNYLGHLEDYEKLLNGEITSESEEGKAATTWYEGCRSFLTSLTTCYKALLTDYSTANSVSQTLYKKSNTITVKETNMGTLSGHISNFLGAAIGLVLGFAISSLFFANYGISKEFREKMTINTAKIVQATSDKPLEVEATTKEISTGKKKEGSSGEEK